MSIFICGGFSFKIRSHLSSTFQFTFWSLRLRHLKPTSELTSPLSMQSNARKHLFFILELSTRSNFTQQHSLSRLSFTFCNDIINQRCSYTLFNEKCSPLSSHFSRRCSPQEVLITNYGTWPFKRLISRIVHCLVWGVCSILSWVADVSSPFTPSFLLWCCFIVLNSKCVAVSETHYFPSLFGGVHIGRVSDYHRIFDVPPVVFAFTQCVQNVNTATIFPS